jgi:hypothetical protein
MLAKLINSLESQKQRITTSVEWLKNLSTEVKKLQKIEFTNINPITENTKEVSIAFSLKQDVHVTSIICIPENLFDLIKDPNTTQEALRIATALEWEKKGTKSIESWFVKEKSIWKGSEQETVIFLTKTIREFMSYWFENPPKAVYRVKNEYEITKREV